MLRVFAAIVGVPVIAIVIWLALGERVDRADFVISSGALRTIDPHRVSWLDEIQVVGALFEGLTRLDPQTYFTEPGVAERWSVSDDRREYTFYLRPDARWSNGEPVIASHFRAAWLRVLNPRVEAQYAGLLFVIAGAREYYESRLGPGAAAQQPAETVGIEALSDRVLRVRLAAPCSYFLDLTSFPTLAPIYPPALEEWAYRDGKVLRATQHLWTRSNNIVCNGAFTLDRWDFKRRLLLRRNHHYWDADAIDLDSIELFITSEPNTALIAYETGRIDLIRGLKPEIARGLITDGVPRNDFHVGDRFATFFFRVNCKRPPLDNADLRKALNLAIDKQALCVNIMGMGETPADTFVPRGSLRLMPRPAPDGREVYYDPPDGLGHGMSYDQRVALARELLGRSGFSGDARPIRISYAKDPPSQERIAEAVQAMWQSALGIRVELDRIERKVLSSRIRSLDYDVVRSDWYGDYMDPSTFLDMFTTGNGQNRTGWSNTEYDRLIAAAAVEPDNRRRFDFFREAERILCQDELPIIPIFFKRGNFLLNPAFGGVNDNIRDVLPIQRVRRLNSAANRAPRAE